MSNGPVGSSIYHYTTLDALKSIVENRSIRLTDYRFLNDPQEVILTKTTLVKKIEEYLKDKNINKTKIEDILSRFDESKFAYCKRIKDEDGKISYVDIDCITSLYVFSLTELRDALEMWSMYGKLGCAIKFNEEKLRERLFERLVKNCDINIGNLVSGKVQYGHDFSAAIENLKVMLEIDYSATLNINIMPMIIQICALQKDESYKYEHEYRVGVIWAKNDVDNMKIKKFLLKNNIYKPQIEINDIPIEEIIEEVIISPYNNNDCAKISVEEFLEYHFNKKIPVHKSQIQIRDL